MEPDCIVGMFMREQVVAEFCNLADEMYSKSRYGELQGKKFYYSLTEAMYLLSKGKMKVFSGRKELDFDSFMAKAQKLESNFWVRYKVYCDLREKGYIVKTALKFGADFRVYDKGVKPGEDHARWVVYPVFGSEKLTWFDFSAKNRVAHSTKKNLLIAVVDDEGDVVYYEVGWVKP